MWKAKQIQMNPINKRFVIGVTGHRILDNLFELKKQLIKVLDTDIQLMIKNDFFPNHKKNTSTPLNYTVITSLAEGADRLVAETILDYNSFSNIDVVLPMRVKNYKKTFNNPDDPQFYTLLDKANSTKILWINNLESNLNNNDSSEINKAFEDAGRYIVNHCDVLFVLWNGIKSGGVGGTYDVFKYALSVKKPIIIISTNHPYTIKARNLLINQFN